MQNKPFQIHTVTVEPGESRIINIPTPGLYAQTPMHLPVHVIHGKEEGPRLFVCAAIHGDEVLGVEIIRRLIKHSALKNVKGTLVAVPVVNIYGFIAQSRYMPDRRDLNRSFPGRREGSLTARVAYIFTNEILSRCTHGIDLHTGAIHLENYPQVRANLNLPHVKKLARAFGAPVVVDVALPIGSLRAAANKLKVPLIVYEAGEALRFNEKFADTGVKGVINVMRQLGMLHSPAKRTLKPKKSSMMAHAAMWVRAPTSGMMRPFKTLGDEVKKGDPLAIIQDPFGGEGVIVEAPLNGIIIGKTFSPLVNTGRALFHLATISRTNVEKIEAQQPLEPEESKEGPSLAGDISKPPDA